MNMKYSCVELNDLPDEILLIIFKKLNNLDVLYSVQGVNERLNKIIHDPRFTTRLNFVKWSPYEFINRFPSNIILDRFCSQILPEISMKIKWLGLESTSMKDILRAANYPNLCGLGLYNVDEETAKCLLTDDRLSSDIFKNQITRLIMTVNPKEQDWSTMENICNAVFPAFSNLTHLTFYESSYENIVRLMVDFPSPNFSSSTLLVLKINVQNFGTCLHLLDGRFNQLHTLSIDLTNIHPSEENENQGEIANLKCFILSSAWETAHYDRLILRLLHRMSNLEKLGLYLSIYADKTFIDGNSLKKNILDRMPHLNRFAFDIRSIIYTNNLINFPSKEDIQHTFRDFQDTKIVCCVDYFQEQKESQCHVYSYPPLTQYYKDITNNFLGGIYQYVRVVSLYDEQPFEHEFFMRIQQSFPFMENLSLINRRPQNHKRFNTSTNDNRSLSIVKYSSLTKLDIQHVHDDYIEEFLCNTKTYFQNTICLDIDYQSLQRVTRNFTRDDTRINCAKINEIFLLGKQKYSETVQDYFPFTKIH